MANVRFGISKDGKLYARSEGSKERVPVSRYQVQDYMKRQDVLGNTRSYNSAKRILDTHSSFKKR